MQRFIRTQTYGIVALEGLARLVIAKVVDITDERLAFIYPADLISYLNTDIDLDVMLFDGHRNIECLLSNIKGRIVSIHDAHDHHDDRGLRLYSLQFNGLSPDERRSLDSYLRLKNSDSLTHT